MQNKKLSSVAVETLFLDSDICQDTGAKIRDKPS